MKWSNDVKSVRTETVAIGPDRGFVAGYRQYERMRFQVPIVYDACNDYVELVVCSMTMRLTLIVAAVIIIPIGADKFTSFALAQGPPPAQTPTSS
ncbi:MAG TPA: hypothetical protein VGQ39_02460, partial [Pyrinomonadaceae bacterium]|nr:hypothetical protein [Pyrinomonadaceae bacterium]